MAAADFLFPVGISRVDTLVLNELKSGSDVIMDMRTAGQTNVYGTTLLELAAPTVTVHGLTITSAGVASTTPIDVTGSISATTSITADTMTATTSLTTAALTASATLDAPVITASTSLSSPAISGDVITATTSVTAPQITATTSLSTPAVTAQTLSATVSIDAPVITATTSVTSPVITATTSVEAPDITATTSLTSPTVTTANLTATVALTTPTVTVPDPAADTLTVTAKKIVLNADTVEVNGTLDTINTQQLNVEDMVITAAYSDTVADDSLTDGAGFKIHGTPEFYTGSNPDLYEKGLTLFKSGGLFDAGGAPVLPEDRQQMVVRGGNFSIAFPNAAEDDCRWMFTPVFDTNIATLAVMFRQNATEDWQVVQTFSATMV